MRYAEYAPSPALARLVERYWMLEGVASGAADAIFPDGRIELVFHYAGSFWRHRDDGAATVEKQPDAMVVGQMLAPVLVAPVGRVGVAAIRLRPAAARALFGFEPGELHGACVDLALIFASARSLREQLAEAATDHDRVARLEQWLLEPRLRAHAPGTSKSSKSQIAPSEPIEAAVRAIDASGGRASIDALAAIAGLHVRQLERRFVQEVGLTPKTFARISRLQRALGRVRAGAALSDVALDCGFYDQAHMARDFRALAAMSPKAWKAHAGALAPLFIAGGAR